MQLLINHLTRMQAGFMCTAGIDLEKRRHIRPVTGQPLSHELLAQHGGPFELRYIVELGPTEFAGCMPEIEDRRFHPELAKVVDIAPQQLWQATLDEVAEERLVDIFGPELQVQQSHYGRPPTAAVPERRGLRSLGCYWAHQPCITIQHFGGKVRVRFRFVENNLEYEVPVTDLRCYQADHVTPCESTVAEWQAMMAQRTSVLTSVGLSRPYRYYEDRQPMHWLQINNVHL